jgi:hypothetical protein
MKTKIMFTREVFEEVLDFLACHFEVMAAENLVAALSSGNPPNLLNPSVRRGQI